MKRLIVSLLAMVAVMLAMTAMAGTSYGDPPYTSFGVAMDSPAGDVHMVTCDSAPAEVVEYSFLQEIKGEKSSYLATTYNDTVDELDRSVPFLGSCKYCDDVDGTTSMTSYKIDPTDPWFPVDGGLLFTSIGEPNGDGSPSQMILG